MNSNGNDILKEVTKGVFPGTSADIPPVEMQKHFIDMLVSKAENEDRGIYFVNRGVDRFYSYMQLYNDVRKIAANLIEIGVQAHDRVVFQLNENESIIKAFWACAYIGAVPVLIPRVQSLQDVPRVCKALTLLPESLIFVDKQSKELLSDADHYAQLILDSDILNPTGAKMIEEPVKIGGKDERLIQFSSGSTGTPKGVIVTEERILEALGTTLPRRGFRFKNSMLTWLPLSHNLSLLGFHINSVSQNFNQVLMPTIDYISNPYDWLEAINRHRPTVTVCPNFGMRHFLDFARLRPLPTSDLINLASVQKVMTGAEPIDANVARKFSELLQPLGLRQDAVSSGYGMSEACLLISAAELHADLKSITLDRDRINIGSAYSDIAAESGATFVSVGKVVNSVELTIRGEDNEVLGTDRVGEIFIKGPTVTEACLTKNGIVKHPLSSDGAFATGDIGMLHDDELFIIGRRKDIIFVNGKNYYSPDLESVLANELGIETIVIGCSSAESGGEEVIVFLERDDHVDEDKTQREIKTVLMRVTGVPVTRVLWIDHLPKAANGKKLRQQLTNEV